MNVFDVNLIQYAVKTLYLAVKKIIIIPIMLYGKSKLQYNFEFHYFYIKLHNKFTKNQLK
jgi:hypothetical protein